MSDRDALPGFLSYWKFYLKSQAFHFYHHPACAVAMGMGLGWLSRLPLPAWRKFQLVRGAYLRLMQSRCREGLLERYRQTLITRIRTACLRRVPFETEVSARRVPPLMEAEFSFAAIVLKAPRLENGVVVERGVLLLNNGGWIDRFRREADMDALLNRYTLVLENSWSGYQDPWLLAFTQYSTHTILVSAPCRDDHEFLEQLNLNLKPISIGSGDWVDPRVFRPLGLEKTFDAVMVARWNVVKRHDLLFSALRRIHDPSFRVALIAMNITEDRDGAREALLEQIRRRGLERQITVFEDISQEEVNQIINRSKVNLLLSVQEGGNRALFEGFFAGTPAIALERNLGIPKNYFVPQTGRLIAERDLAKTLLEFREAWNQYKPRCWAMEHISPEKSTAYLNAQLKRLAAERGEPWTRDIVAKANTPNLTYYPDDSVGAGMETTADLLGRSQH